MDDVVDASVEGQQLALGSAFATPSIDQWRALVDKVLSRGADLDHTERDRRFKGTLVTSTQDGFDVQPLYTAHDALAEPGVPGSAPFVRGGASALRAVAQGWDVRQAATQATPQATNDAVLAELTGGATSVSLRIGAAGVLPEDLGRALDGVMLDLAGVCLHPDTPADALAGARALAELITAPEAATGSFGLDPLGHAARTGLIDRAERDALYSTAAELAPRFVGMTTLVADGLPVHEAGGSDAEELASVLAVGAEHLRALVDLGVPVGLAARTIELRLAATADQFATIAKIRAARGAWARLTEVAGVAPSDRAARVHAATSWSMTSRRDPWVNLLRTTVATFAAGIAGADSVTVVPFDAAIGRPDAFGRRLARNIQALLIDESSVARVIDPAGGSWYVEQRTALLAESAWTWFRDLEAVGGYAAALEQGVVAERLAATRARRMDAIAHRQDPLTGVSEFPLVDEEPLQRESEPPLPGGGLPRIRYAQDFEALRDRADASTAAGMVPEVLIVAVGPVAAFTARATFAKNFFESGGVRTRIVEVAASQSVGDAVADARVVCLCSSDEVYAETVISFAPAIKEAGVERIVLAGKPPNRDAMAAAGVDEFIHAATDVLASVSRTLDVLGVPA